MTPESRDALVRAIGLLEGLSYAAPDNIGEGICEAIESLLSIFRKEIEGWREVK